MTSHIHMLTGPRGGRLGAGPHGPPGRPRSTTSTHTPHTALRGLKVEIKTEAHDALEPRPQAPAPLRPCLRARGRPPSPQSRLRLDLSGPARNQPVGPRVPPTHTLSG